MRPIFEFRIQGLLQRKEDNTISGPMSPVEFAREMVRQTDHKINRLARVWLEGEDFMQEMEGDGYTGYHLLILARQYSNDLWLSLWVDKGTGGIPVASAYASDRNPVVTPIYRKTRFARKLSDLQIKTIFNYIFDNPTQIAIRDDKLTGTTSDTIASS